MENAEVVEKLTNIFRNVFKDRELTLTGISTEKDSAPWDSLSLMLLIREIECGFSIKFKLKDLSEMQSIEDMIRIVISKL
jgi:acyl carrier protein